MKHADLNGVRTYLLITIHQHFASTLLYSHSLGQILNFNVRSSSGREVLGG